VSKPGDPFCKLAWSGSVSGQVEVIVRL